MTKPEMLEKAARFHDAEFKLFVYAAIGYQYSLGTTQYNRAYLAFTKAAQISGLVKAWLQMAQGK